MLTREKLQKFTAFAAKIRAEEVSLSEVSAFQHHHNPDWQRWWDRDKYRERMMLKNKLNGVKYTSNRYRRIAP